MKRIRFVLLLFIIMTFLSACGSSKKSKYHINPLEYYRITKEVRKALNDDSSLTLKIEGSLEDYVNWYNKFSGDDFSSATQTKMYKEFANTDIRQNMSEIIEYLRVREQFFDYNTGYLGRLYSIVDTYNTSLSFIDGNKFNVSDDSWITIHDKIVLALKCCANDDSNHLIKVGQYSVTIPNDPEITNEKFNVLSTKTKSDISKLIHEYAFWFNSMGFTDGITEYPYAAFLSSGFDFYRPWNDLKNQPAEDLNSDLIKPATDILSDVWEYAYFGQIELIDYYEPNISLKSERIVLSENVWLDLYNRLNAAIDYYYGNE